MPDGLAVVRQCRQAADVDAFARRMEIRSARSLEAERAGQVGKLAVFGRMVTAGDDLDALAAQRTKGVQQQVQFARVERVASRMRDHRRAAAGTDPAYGVFQRGPFMLDVTGMTACQKTPEGAAHVGRMPLRHQPAGEVRAPHHLLVGGVIVGAFIRATDAGPCQIGAHALRAFDAAMTNATQTGSQLGMRRIDAQADDVDRLPVPGHRDLDAGDQRQSCGIRCRARIRKEDNKTLVISEIPFGTTTTSLIGSILKANEKGKIKVRHIEDNTAENAEIVIHLAAGVSPDTTIDALFAFTDCEVSLAPNAVVIENDKPRFVDVKELLRISTENTLRLLEMELRIRKGELEEQWHFASLERIFIEKRIYRRIEEAETWDEVIGTIHKGLKPHIQDLRRSVTDEDVVKLTEIRIKRISKFDSFKADEHIRHIEEQLAQVMAKLDAIVDHAVDWFKELKKKYGAGRERKTELRAFDTIVAAKVAVANKKLYLDRNEGFIGWSLRNDEFVDECSEIDDIIVFRRSGQMLVTKVAEKKFVGKGVIHVGVFKKNDERTIYHMIYQDGTKGAYYTKRFAVTGITRDKEYDLTAGSPGSTVEYFTCNPDGAGETVRVTLRPRPNLRKPQSDVDFGQMLVKGRGSKGNLLTRYMVQKIVQKDRGGSTLGAIPIWFDETVRRLNDTGHGRYLGRFKGDDRILAITKAGSYQFFPFVLSTHFPDDTLTVVKWNPKDVVSVVYWDGEKQQHNIKRFVIEEASRDPVRFITEHAESRLVVHSLVPDAAIHVAYDKRSVNKEDEDVSLARAIGVKGVKAIGNRLTPHKVKEITLTTPVFIPMTPEIEEKQQMLITDEEVGNLDAPEEEGLEESPVKQMKRRQDKEAGSERSPDDPIIGYKPGKQISLGLDD